MSTDQKGDSVVSELYDNYTDTQKEIYQIEIRKTRNKLITTGIVIFAFDLIALAVADLVMVQTILWILVVPVILIGLAFLALKEPLLAMIIAAVIIGGIWIYQIVMTGGYAAIAGWISKAIIIYLIIAGFQNATEATRIKKELKGVI